MLFYLFGVVMFRILFISFMMVFLASLSLPFDNVQANKKDARESMTPTESYHLYMPSPFKDKSTFDTQDQK